MNSERIFSVEERARKHAALADPARLRMLDMLTYGGDLSPTELREELGVPSNLLAHHLGVLEREGIITRGRSEGDKRRSYVRLVPGALFGLGSFAAAGADRVVFVCSANSARSQLAEALWNTVSSVPAQSAGTHPPAERVAPGAIATAARHGLDLTGAVPRLVDDVDMDGRSSSPSATGPPMRNTRPGSCTGPCQTPSVSGRMPRSRRRSRTPPSRRPARAAHSRPRLNVRPPRRVSRCRCGWSAAR